MIVDKVFTALQTIRQTRGMHSQEPQTEAKIDHGTEPSNHLASERQRQLRAPALEIEDREPGAAKA
jgi:hypothetical protein